MSVWRRAQHGPNRDAPVLAFTADADLGDLAELGPFDGVVRKPIDAHALAAAIAEAFVETGSAGRAPTRAAGQT